MFRIGGSGRFFIYSKDKKVRDALLGLVVQAPDVVVGDQIVIPFEFNKFQIGPVQLQQIKKLAGSGKTKLQLKGYASNTSGQDDIRISLFRALQVKSEISKRIPGVSIVKALGNGVKKNKLCAAYSNQCVIVVAG